MKHWIFGWLGLLIIGCGVACGTLPLSGVTPTPIIVVITATPNSTSIPQPIRYTRTPMPTATTMVPSPIVTSGPVPTIPRASSPTVTSVPVSCPGGVQLFNYNGGVDEVFFSLNGGTPIRIPPRSDKGPGYLCLPVSPGTHTWSASLFRHGSTHGTLHVAPGQPLAPINFCQDENGKLTTVCGSPPTSVPTPTPTTCCARRYLDPSKGTVVIAYRQH